MNNLPTELAHKDFQLRYAQADRDLLTQSSLNGFLNLYDDGLVSGQLVFQRAWIAIQHLNSGYEPVLEALRDHAEEYIRKFADDLQRIRNRHQ